MIDDRLKKKIEKNISIYFIWKIFFAMFFLTPTIVLFWQEHGLSFFQITLLQAFYSILIFILEIPSGWIADRWGRKNTIRLGATAILIAVCAYSLGSNFAQFMIAEFFFAIGFSSISGADSALLYDSLLFLNRQDEYKRIMGRTRAWFLISMGASTALGGFLGSINLRFPLMAMIFSMGISAILSFFFTEAPYRVEAKTRAQVLEVVKTPGLMFILAYGAILLSFGNAILWFYQPYFKLSGLPIWSYGLLFSLFNITAALFSAKAHVISEKISEKYILASMPLLLMISYLGMAAFIGPLGVALTLIQQVVRGFSSVFLSDEINIRVPSNMRATSLSVLNFGYRFLAAVMMPIFGKNADNHGLIWTFILIAMYGIAFFTLLFFLRKKNVFGTAKEKIAEG
jgi:MFS family permease